MIPVCSTFFFKYQDSMSQSAKLFACFLCLLLVTVARAGETEDVIALVQKWNGLHNTRETHLFKEIYAPNVLFYGKNKTGSKCFQSKQTFLTPDFKQQIITPVSLIHYSSGTIKANFTKRVTYKRKVKEHECYLLLKMINGR
jgi:hypothetical protein